VSLVTWDDPIPAAGELGTVHLVGIGGAGMSGIARLLVAQGIPVSGCDAKDSSTLAALRALGVQVSVGHAAEHAALADTFVVSSAIRPDNPDLVAARAAGRRTLPRAVGLAAAMAAKRRIAVAGTHGKTTTTSMLTVALQACGEDPSYAIGGDLNEPGSNAHHGTGRFFVAEADESDQSFLVLHPDVAVVTNVEADHLDNYGTPAAVDAAFERFVTALPSDGALVAGADDPGAARLLAVARDSGVPAIGFGTVPGAAARVEHLTLSAAGSTFVYVHRGRRLGAVRLTVPGAYNAMNAAAALTAGMHLGLPFGEMVRGLADFRGARRRFESRGAAAAVRVYDDYAHHPTEVAAVLEGARLVAGDGRVVAVFQPHLFSRTMAFAEQFGQALGEADAVVVMDVYAAREDPIPGVTGALVANHVPLPADRVVFEPSWSRVAGRVADLAAPGDLVLTIGAGDVTMLAPALLAALQERV
jgi:UDP-N-acetylmuramate--alanine ligase